MRLLGPQSQDAARVPAIVILSIWIPTYRLKHPPQRAVAQRLCALAHLVACRYAAILQRSDEERTSLAEAESDTDDP